MSTSTSTSTVNWLWILENMRYCSKCGNYKVLDSFQDNQAKCKACSFHYHKKERVTKPVPVMLANEIEIQANIQKALTGSSRIKINLGGGGHSLSP